tara:strand:+ start:1157 stop:1933 length:777 start_codon:yes stop_codon:yes gene_type:complete
MAFTQSEQELLLQSGFRKIGNFFDWGETIGGVRYIAKASGELYQLVPAGTAVWTVICRTSNYKNSVVTTTGSRRSALPSNLPPVQFMDAVYAQYPCAFTVRDYVNGNRVAGLPVLMSESVFFGNNTKPAVQEYDEVKAAFEKRHPIDAQQVEDQEKTRIFLEWKAMKDKAFFDALFEPVKELRAQGKSDAADKLQRSIQADLDKGILTPQTPKTRPAMDIQTRTMPFRYQTLERPQSAPVAAVPEGPKRLRRIILEDD